ncbi:hypothetical protein [Kitasatospora sp. NPDC059462]|uniref:hypothetical protein n=1 Tax=Kitasatospora sp. NPDC059462 TaxID=3346841 RepID=UPI0036A1272E
MENGSLLSSALADARIAYGSLTSPDFSFAARACQRQPYRRLMERISEFSKVEDNTHLDEDVCFYCKISSSSGNWHLLLSMVGPYAMLFRAPKAHRWSARVILTPIVDGLERDEEKIFALICQWGFSIVSGDQSKIPVEFPEWPGGPMEEGPLFRILFSDAWDLAW